MNNAELAVTPTTAMGISENYLEVLKTITALYASGRLTTLVPLLPLLLALKGQPMTLQHHFVMEPLFSLQLPRNFVLKTARQVSKTTSLAAQGCVLAAVIQYFASLYIAPRYEQTRRFSNNYVKPFLRGPLGRSMISPADEQSVLQRSFLNGSTLHFSFAFLDADRVRGLAVDQCRFDEVQDIDSDFIPVINETLSGSKYDLRQYVGTPKTFDNTIQGLWDDSSQAEWIIKCGHCNHWNIGSVEFDLMSMIGKDGLSCAKCGRLIEDDAPRGRWEHRIPERRFTFAGYHVSQPIMPVHYLPNPVTRQKIKWNALWLAKHKTAKAFFLNEKLGESCDVRVSLVTKKDLQTASTLPSSNDIMAARKLIKNYPIRTMGIDWGGGGEKGISHTALAVLGHAPGGRIDVIYGERLVNVPDPADEAGLILRYFRMFKCFILGHDFGGAGVIRETLLIQAGLPMESIFPAYYIPATAKAMVTYKAPTGDSVRSYYTIDKTRSLLLLCQLIKHGVYRFPKFESWELLADDFLSLVEDRRRMARGPDLLVITSKTNRSDDFSHAVNFGSLAHWHVSGHYPNLARQIGIQITPEQEESENPEIG